MARLITADDKPVRPASDPLASANAAVARLAHLVEQVASRPAPKPAELPPIEFPPSEPRPIRLEADVERDSKGRMTRVVVTPIYY